MSPHLRKSRITTLFIILFALQNTACSSEENYNKSESNGNDILNAPNYNDGTDIDNPAIISGTDSGSVTEDVDPNGDTLLEVDGQLTILDNDPNEAVFLASVVDSRYGRLTITEDGYWHYIAFNILAAIQSLNAGESLQDYLTIRSIDGTAHEITITIYGADELNQAAVITGIDNVNLTEDDADSNNLLAANGKLNITDIDDGEAEFITKVSNAKHGRFAIDKVGNWFYFADNQQSAIQNLDTGERLMERLTVSSIDGTAHDITITILGVDDIPSPAIISGVDSGNITEDVSADGNNLLNVNGALTISDDDPGEAIFRTMVTNTNYGRFALTTNGNWYYVADNSKAIIQNLNSGESLTDKITVSSIDDTTHDVTITINGADETSTTADITLSWTAPVEREDSTALSPSEISGYKIYYGSAAGQHSSSVSVGDSSAVNFTFKDFAISTYFFAITTIDTGGRESQKSTEVSISN